MAEQTSVVECMYRSRQQFRAHILQMLEKGYEVNLVNGRRSPVVLDRAGVRTLCDDDMPRLFGSAPYGVGFASVTYRLATRGG